MLNKKLFLVFCVILTWNSCYSAITTTTEAVERDVVSEAPTTEADAPYVGERTQSFTTQNDVSNNVVDGDEKDVNLTKNVNLVQDLLLKTSQLIILNNLDKKVDAIAARLDATNVTQVLNDFKEELLSEVRAIVRDSSRKNCDDVETHDSVTVESLLGDGRNCLIKNRRFPEYFYAAEGFDYDSERRQTFTWIPGWHDAQCFWDLERSWGNRSLTTKYRIKSVKYDEYLYAAADDLKYDTHRRRVFTWKPNKACEHQCYWDIQLLRQKKGDKEHYFTIRNTEYGEYFFAFDGGKDNFDADRRQAFTWKFDPNHDVENDHQSQWTIKCNQ